MQGNRNFPIDFWNVINYAPLATLKFLLACYYYREKTYV